MFFYSATMLQSGLYTFLEEEEEKEVSPLPLKRNIHVEYDHKAEKDGSLNMKYLLLIGG